MNLEPVSAALAIEALKSTLSYLSGKAKPKAKAQITKWKTNQNVEKLRSNIRQIENISTIASKKTSTIDDIYYPARIRIGKNTNKLITHASEFFQRKSRIALILGTAGQGKSIFLRFLCLNELEINGYIPLFVELRKIDKEKTLKTLLHEHLKNIGIGEEDTGDVLNLLLESGTSRLFLDGYDEISREYSLRTKSEITHLLRENEALEIIITSRPGAISQHLSDSFDIFQCDISTIAPSDHDDFFRKIGVEIDTRKRLISAIGRSRAEIRNLLSTPLMLTLLFITCGAQQDLPDTLPEFYDSLFNVLSSTHDGTKPGYTRQKATSLGNAELERLFCSFSFASKELFKRNSLTHRQFEDSFNHASRISDIKCTLEGFRTDITETVCLMINDGLDTAFIHKSIQEYYAARFIHKLEEKSHAETILKEIENSGIFEWLNEIQFLEDFRDRVYENTIGIPHIIKILSELRLKSRKNSISWIRLKKFIQNGQMSIGRYRENKNISTVSWHSFKEKIYQNRYSIDLTTELAHEIIKSAPQNSRVPTISDTLEVVQLSKLADNEPNVKNLLIATTQRFCDSLEKKKKAMEERQHRQNSGLLSLLKNPKG